MRGAGALWFTGISMEIFAVAEACMFGMHACMHEGKRATWGENTTAGPGFAGLDRGRREGSLQADMGRFREVRKMLKLLEQ